ncbi:hypothetical protein Taro_011771 [Colocasia esculenta]|uniref:Uncharacterized protein n=1 Tax=Colocasia esculenta TaxID=4460 RepID=A0A843U297_COLES|nr:hypothetical protein [Colocasia esculenta]
MPTSASLSIKAQDYTTTFGAVCGNRRSHGSRTILILERGEQGDEIPSVARGLSPAIPPVDVAIAPAGANHDVPAPAAAAPTTTLEVAELRGQMQQLTGVCLALQV